MSRLDHPENSPRNADPPSPLPSSAPDTSTALRPRDAVAVIADFYRDPLSWPVVAVTSVILCYVGGLAIFWFHYGLLGEGGPAISWQAHWLLDSSLAFVGLTPLIGILIPLAAWSARRLSASPRRAVWLYALLVGSLLALVTAPAPFAHNALVGEGTWFADRMTALIGDPSAHTAPGMEYPAAAHLTQHLGFTVVLYPLLMMLIVVALRAWAGDGRSRPRLSPALPGDPPPRERETPPGSLFVATPAYRERPPTGGGAAPPRATTDPASEEGVSRLRPLRLQLVRLRLLLGQVSLPLLRVSLGVVFVWFGALKTAGVTPVGALVASTVPWFDATWFVPVLGCFEALLGLALIVGRFLGVLVTVMIGHLSGTFLVFVMLPETAFQSGNPLLLTMEGEFVAKNIILITAGLVVAAGERMREPRR